MGFPVPPMTPQYVEALERERQREQEEERRRHETPKHYDPTTTHPPHQRSGPQENHLVPPSVPQGSSKGRTTAVNTPSMELFADNMDELARPVKQAYDRLMQLHAVNPGAFYDAYMLREVTCGANGDSGLQNTYLKILHDLGQGLADISSGVRTLSAKYKTTEEESKMTAEDLNKAFESAQGDFNKLNTGG